MVTALRTLWMVALLAAPARAMHLAEGVLPAPWALLWLGAAAPFLVRAMREVRLRSEADPAFQPLLALVGAVVFVVSCMPVPIPTAGTCSHPCGTGLAALLLGPLLTVAVASVALVLQALFLAHGGVTTLGADLAAMGVAGAFCGYGAFRAARWLGLPETAGAFLAGVAADWATYAATALILAAGLYPAAEVGGAFLALLAAFAPTQVPLGILEGFLTAGAWAFVRRRRPALLPLGQGGRP